MTHYKKVTDVRDVVTDICQFLSKEGFDKFIFDIDRGGEFITISRSTTDAEMTIKKSDNETMFNNLIDEIKEYRYQKRIRDLRDEFEAFKKAF